MKHVVSISIGSSKRDHRVEVELLGERFLIERIGTDGDLEKAIELVRQLDGKVDAFGMGGIDLYVHAANRRYAFRDARRIARAAQQTPMVDGSGLKNSLERWVVQYLDTQTDVALRGKRVLMTASVDRFGMAEAFYELGCEMVFGDVIFALGIPWALHKPSSIAFLARMLLPIVTQLPFRLLYPTGDKQETTKPRFGRFFAEADVIAGDFLYIRRYMPKRLDNKVILTNTVTAADVEEIGSRGARCLATTTPNLGGRSFGTNVLEAVLVVVSGKQAAELSAEDYLRLLDDLGFQPRIERFTA